MRVLPVVIAVCLLAQTAWTLQGELERHADGEQSFHDQTRHPRSASRSRLRNELQVLESMNHELEDVPHDELLEQMQRDVGSVLQQQRFRRVKGKNVALDAGAKLLSALLGGFKFSFPFQLPPGLLDAAGKLKDALSGGQGGAEGGAGLGDPDASNKDDAAGNKGDDAAAADAKGDDAAADDAKDDDAAASDAAASDSDASDLSASEAAALAMDQQTAEQTKKLLAKALNTTSCSEGDCSPKAAADKALAALVSSPNVDVADMAAASGGGESSAASAAAAIVSGGVPSSLKKANSLAKGGSGGVSGAAAAIAAARRGEDPLKAGTGSHTGGSDGAGSSPSDGSGADGSASEGGDGDAGVGANAAGADGSAKGDDSTSASSASGDGHGALSGEGGATSESGEGVDSASLSPAEKEEEAAKEEEQREAEARGPPVEAIKALSEQVDDQFSIAELAVQAAVSNVTQGWTRAVTVLDDVAIRSCKRAALIAGEIAAAEKQRRASLRVARMDGEQAQLATEEGEVVSRLEHMHEAMQNASASHSLALALKANETLVHEACESATNRSRLKRVGIIRKAHESVVATSLRIRDAERRVSLAEKALSKHEESGTSKQQEAYTQLVEAEKRYVDLLKMIKEDFEAAIQAWNATYAHPFSSAYFESGMADQEAAAALAAAQEKITSRHVHAELEDTVGEEITHLEEEGSPLDALRTEMHSIAKEAVGSEEEEEEDESHEEEEEEEEDESHDEKEEEEEDESHDEKEEEEEDESHDDKETQDERE
jgi:hypothetical protein